MRPWNRSDWDNKKVIDRVKIPDTLYSLLIRQGLAALVRSVFDCKSKMLAASFPLVPLLCIYSNVMLLHQIKLNLIETG